jgi:purine-cytosine permease-like protein
MSGQSLQPEADRAWAIERHGIEPIDDRERHGRPFELFWVWFAANLGILGIVYGAILATSGLNLWQSVLVAVVAPVLSFLLVGLLGVAGKWGGVPMLTLSRACFGTRGNLGPTLVSWISLVGWEIISVITATYAFLGLLNLAGLPENSFWTVVSLSAVALLVVALGLLGHATLVWISRAATWVFGLFTLLIVMFLVARTHWSAILATPPGPWDTGLLAMMSIVLAGTGISWVNASADYTRYLPRASKGRAIILWTVCGSSLPLFVLIVTGALLASSVPGLASASNPVQVIGSALPSWMAVPYLLTAIGGLIAEADFSIYSSGLNILAMGIKLKRYQAVLIDGVLMIFGSVYVLLIAHNFLAPFESFLQLLADGLCAWSAVFLVDMLRRRGYDALSLAETGAGNRYFYRGGLRWEALIAWLLGILVSLAFTVSPWFAGPFAVGIFASSSLGYAIGFLVSGLSAWALFSCVALRSRGLKDGTVQ